MCDEAESAKRVVRVAQVASRALKKYGASIDLGVVLGFKARLLPIVGCGFGCLLATPNHIS